MSKSAITPFFNGRITRMLPGVLPTILYASVPTATTLFVLVLTATTDGSFKTIPLPETLMSTLAVPKSIPISRATIILHKYSLYILP